MVLDISTFPVSIAFKLALPKQEASSNKQLCSFLNFRITEKYSKWQFLFLFRDYIPFAMISFISTSSIPSARSLAPLQISEPNFYEIRKQLFPNDMAVIYTSKVIKTRECPPGAELRGSALSLAVRAKRGIAG